ncbi:MULTISPECIES: hypothetical protein [Bordetella]|uniref:Uncharacterized protein n=1 Tax=Bordetella genomosp. 6 TaxID=463024 RepID=A0ABX4FBV6_9BORD|nr:MULTISPECIES: hypothetical protein [Bordetella]AOB27406.1 hypothetical protein BBB44_14705 [Bordetella bronchiseptica]ARP77128.1 hypothetical protein CAL11_13715 [Bordetella genomosp. 6]AZW44717.1 hypothetical protein CWR61_14830 [Bordetella bronchiseptica]KCV63677.1 hypothetical protein L493_2084 [Bordetella bronchiseptica 99-R-0433]MBN3270226.1 hypothetical protein [Bordetella bronchiseptica]
MKKIAALIIALAAAPALAKLPPPSPEAAAKAKETAAKAAWSGKMDAFRLCRVQDEVAATYFERAKAAGKTTRAPMATPECKDPGPFVYNAEDKPREASGAHSPADTAAKPPSTPAPAAEQKPGQ